MDKVKDLSQRYPFVEWALLYSPSEIGKPRYPTREWMADFHRDFPDLHKSVHLCHEGLFGFIDGSRTISDVIAPFPRVQLNVGFGVHIAAISPDAMARSIAAEPDKIFILQYSDKTKHILEALAGLKNVEVLFDGSAGRGESPTSWPAPLPGFTCGYAGGIGPHNAGSTIETLLSIVPKGTRTWIDMESRVRTNDRLDLGKVESVLEQVQLVSLKPVYRLALQMEPVVK